MVGDAGGQLPTFPDGAPFPSEEAQAVQRLSSTAHWIVPVLLNGTAQVDLLAWSATPPIFDGPEDRNGKRARDELGLWRHVMDGRIGTVTDQFVVIGNANLDPVDGAGDSAAMRAFLSDSRLQDPAPASAGGRLAADPGHEGDPALDTADWTDGDPGNLRVNYVLPSAALTVTGAGVFWPAPGEPGAGLLGEDGLAAGPHRLVWVDVVAKAIAQHDIERCRPEIGEQPVEFR